MTEARGWGLPESHLLPDAVVAFVDGELSLGARDRASSHIARCPSCAGDVAAQRQARAEVKRADAPAMSAGFLASLRDIPQHTELRTTPDNLAITEDGQLVAIQRPDRVAGLRDGSAPLGSTAPLGNSRNVLGGGRFGVSGRRAAQGAGVVVSGLVLSALALVATSGTDGGDVATDPKQDPLSGVLPAQFGAYPVPSSLAPPSSSASASTKAGVPTGR
ncbi:anti-sigma factor family protein [Amycolatopsis magusensis]|uniref:Anti-sigma factor RsiW n=1 Tax=Amycolatopsis magusensis TaxID=882444 RepID=A0ABS4PN03_9PSEU|nr:zf-HC2 domain-containing protein [Amycolatopsis magusensis]MBP2180801.1 anti-sigma factor RsiW [Amycolatopsis magusensis]